MSVRASNVWMKSFGIIAAVPRVRIRRRCRAHRAPRAPRDRPRSRPRALPHGRETAQYSEGSLGVERRPPRGGAPARAALRVGGGRAAVGGLKARFDFGGDL